MEVSANSKISTLGKRKAGSSGDGKEDAKRKPPVTLYNFGYAPKDVIEKFQHFCINYPTLTAAIESLLARDEQLTSKYRFISSSVTYQMLARPTVKDDPAAIKAAILKLHKYAKDGRYKSVSDAIEELLMSTSKESGKNHLSNGEDTSLSSKERAALEKISDAVYKKLKSYQTDNAATDNLSASDNDDDDDEGDGDDDYRPTPQEGHSESPPPPMVTPGGKNSTSSKTPSDKPAGPTDTAGSPTVKTEPIDQAALSSGVSTAPARVAVGIPVTTTRLSATGKQPTDNAENMQTNSSTTSNNVPAFVPRYNRKASRFQGANSASANTATNHSMGKAPRRKVITPLKTPKVENVEMEGMLFPSRILKKSVVAAPDDQSPGKRASLIRAASARVAANKATTPGVSSKRESGPERVSVHRRSSRAVTSNKRKTLTNKQPNAKANRPVQKKHARQNYITTTNGYSRKVPKPGSIQLDKEALQNMTKKKGFKDYHAQEIQFANAAKAVPADLKTGNKELEDQLKDGKVMPLLIPLSSYIESPPLTGTALFAEMIKEKNKGDVKSRLLYEKCNLVAQSLVPEYHKENPFIHLTR